MRTDKDKIFIRIGVCSSPIKAKVVGRIAANIKLTESGCWEWTGAQSGDGTGAGRGYGRVRVHGHTSAVHRVVWSMVHGYLPGKKHIDHICFNRLCCNPDHLEMVTARENFKRRDRRTSS